MTNPSPKFQDRDLIGGIFEAIRHYHGLTLNDIYSKLGYEVSTWSRLESGLRSLKFVEAYEFSNHFEFTLTELLDLVDMTRAEKKEDEQWLAAGGRAYRALLARKRAAAAVVA